MSDGLSIEELEESGSYLAVLPYFSETQRLAVEVGIWDAYGQEGSAVTICLQSGLMKNEYLDEDHLDGAVFYKIDEEDAV